MYSVFVLLLLPHCFISIPVMLSWCASRSSLYCNIPSDLSSLCLSCCYFHIVLSLYLYCCYVLYPDHHNNINEWVVMFCIQIITIVLMNGCFYNGPVICPRSVIMARGGCNDPRQRRGPLHPPRVIITDRGHITGPL